uniref:Uncharacterized protein n=1 Tax=Tanacetum cinerariifolium TaxID=118510 RepID=A0A6L2NRV7_TANCI|nr:hypothetical protein [Tanacetum cinerariifolium]
MPRNKARTDEIPLPKYFPTASEERFPLLSQRVAPAEEVCTTEKLSINRGQRHFYISQRPPQEVSGTGSESKGSAKKKGRTVAVTTEDMQKRMNDVKARTTLLLALPDEHQLRFSKYKTAQELWVAILKTFGGNEATKKTKKNQLKQQYGNFKAEGSETLEQSFNRLQAIVSHLEFMDVEIEQDDLNQKFLTSLAPEWLMYTIVRRNRSDLYTMSLDDLYNHLKVYEPEVQKKSESNSQNMAFISSAKNSSGKGEVNTASIPTARTQVSPASADVAAASISLDIVCAYIVSQSNGSQIKYKDINQIDEDDIEEMDINQRLNASIATRWVILPGSAGHPGAKTGVEEKTSNKSYMANEEENHASVANEEAPTEFALMAKSSSKNEVKARLVEFKNQEIKFCKKIKGVEFNVESKNNRIERLTNELKELKKEKKGLDSKLTDEPVSPLGDVSQGEAFPTVSGLEAGQDRENIIKTSALPHDLTPRVTSLAADEGSMQHHLQELMDLCTRLQRLQTKMATKITAQDLEIYNLKARITFLEDKDGGGAEPSRKDATIKERSLETWKEAGVERSTKRGKVSTVGIPTGSGLVPIASPIFTTVSVVTPYSRRKGKEEMVESDTPKKKKLQEQIDVQDAEIARIHAEEELQMLIDGLDRNNEVIARHLHEYEQAAAELTIREKIDLINELVKYQDHHAKIIKYQAQQSKPLSKKQQREFYMSVLKSHSGWKTKHFKGMTLEEIREKFIPVWKQIEDFVPIASKEEGERVKRKGLRLEQESAKKMKTSEEGSEEDLKEMMQLVLVEEVKHPIIDWEIHTEGKRDYWKIIRLGGSTTVYQIFMDMLKHLDREDLNQMWTLVKETLSIRQASSDKEKELWVELKSDEIPLPEYFPTASEERFPLLSQRVTPAKEVCTAEKLSINRGQRHFYINQRRVSVIPGMCPMIDPMI